MVKDTSTNYYYWSDGGHENKTWRPAIIKVHLSKKIVKGINPNESEAEIIVTPIIGVEKDKSYSGEKIPFHITQEIILNSMGWGKNNFVIVSGDLKQVVTVVQAK